MKENVVANVQHTPCICATQQPCVTNSGNRLNEHMQIWSEQISRAAAREFAKSSVIILTVIFALQFSGVGD
jgi:hypothetical protein